MLRTQPLVQRRQRRSRTASRLRWLLVIGVVTNAGVQQNPELDSSMPGCRMLLRARRVLQLIDFRGMASHHRSLVDMACAEGSKPADQPCGVVHSATCSPWDRAASQQQQQQR